MAHGIGRTKGGRNTKLHAVCDAKGRPVVLLLTPGNVHDCKVAQRCIEAMPPSAELVADKGYDSQALREWLDERGTQAVIPPRKNRKIQYEYDKAMGTNKADMVVNGHKVSLDAPSLFDGKGKPPNIAVFEQLGDGTPVKSLKNTDVAGLARHEAGHAYSAAHGFLSMQDKKFQAAMVNDVNNISPAQMQQLMKEVQPGGPMNYYLGSPAKEEFFAEAFATATGQGSDKYAARRMQELFPNVMKYMRDSTK